MAQIINISIDLNKVDKKHIKVVTLKSGATAKFLNLTLFMNDEQDQYGNICSISLPQSEEQRSAKEPKTYLGNGKRVWASNPNAESKPKEQTNNSTEDDDLPF